MKSIGAKLMLQIAIAVTITMLVFGVLSVYQRQHEFTVLLDAKEKRTTEQLALIIARLVYDVNTEQIENVIHSYLTDPDLVSIKVLERGKLLNHFVRDPKTSEILNVTTPPTSPLPDPGEYALRTAQLVTEESELGSLEVLYSRQYIHTQVSRTILELGLSLCLIIIVTSGVVLVLVRRNITRPLTHLVQTARQIACGNVNSPLRKFVSRDEIGTLSLAFESMMTYLQRMTRIATGIATGDLTQEITPQSPDDVLGAAFQNMTGHLKHISEEIDGLIHAVHAGNLSARIPSESFAGEWRNLIEGLNTVMDAFVTPITMTAAALDQIAKGAVPEKIATAYQGDFIAIKENLNLLIDTTRQITHIAQEMAAGNLLVEFNERSQDDTLLQALNTMIQQLNKVVITVKIAAQDMAQRSRELSVVAEQLSEGTSRQAVATEEVSASMEEMAANIRQTADNARLTEGMAVTSAEDARAGKEAVMQMIQAMEVIADRISVVQEIASQTNLLSLNATIEAAKAQEYGKGFTVVASSVRELARQSRTAAEEIRALVHSCVALSAQAGEVLNRLVPNSEKTAELVQEINAASQEESTGVEHVNQAIQQLDTVTQHNSATAEEVAATAENLTTQADALQHTMAFFTINEAVPVAAKEEGKWQQFLESLANAPSDTQTRLLTLFQTAFSPANPPHLAQHSSRTQAPPPHESAQGMAISLSAPNGAGDERDQEFERY